MFWIQDILSDMAQPTCVKCGNTSFETRAYSPVGANFKLTFVQCTMCGGVIGVMDFYNIGQLIHDLATKLGRPLD
jgi:predicted nucleic-acid-binding Zn-ribbon protein